MRLCLGASGPATLDAYVSALPCRQRAWQLALWARAQILSWPQRYGREGLQPLERAASNKDDTNGTETGKSPCLSILFETISCAGSYFATEHARTHSIDICLMRPADSRWFAFFGRTGITDSI
eukprot:6216770-Amphidinium_carterae.1